MTYDMRVLEKLRRKHNEQVQKEIEEMKETKLAIIYAAREYSPATTTNNIVKNFQPVLDGDVEGTMKIMTMVLDYITDKKRNEVNSDENFNR